VELVKTLELVADAKRGRERERESEREREIEFFRV
jgi:hypothetical protein